jgi:hypothetical protein
MAESYRAQSPAPSFRSQLLGFERASSPHPLNVYSAANERAKQQQTPEKFTPENNYGYGKVEDARRSSSPSLHPLDRASSPSFEGKEGRRSFSPEKTPSSMRSPSKVVQQPEPTPPPFQDLMETLENPKETASQQQNEINAEPEQASLPESTKRDDTQGWVTVFGFLRSQSENILKEFRNIGELIQCSWGPGESNWVHIHYKDPHSCHRALQRSGYIIGGSMIGVMPYSLFVEHKFKQGGVQPTPLKNVGTGNLIREPQIKNYKAIKPLLQQPISVVTRDISPVPYAQSYFSIIVEYIFGLW